MASRFSNKDRAPIALIVEDDADLRELGAAVLEETDLRVVECADAEEAMAIMAREGAVAACLDGGDVGLRRAAAGETSRHGRLYAQAVARARGAGAGREGRG